MERRDGLTPDDPRFAELDAAIARYRDRSDGAVYVLERAKYLFGALPVQVVHYIADRLEIARADLYQACTFYDLFAARPDGEHHIAVCLGTDCYLAGTGKLFDRLQAELGIGPGETTPDGLFTLHVCYGGEECDGQPSFYIDGERYTVEPDEVRSVLEQFRKPLVTAE